MSRARVRASLLRQARASRGQAQAWAWEPGLHPQREPVWGRAQASAQEPPEFPGLVPVQARAQQEPVWVWASLPQQVPASVLAQPLREPQRL